MSTGIFDIIGPNMIGPSSSHTAGALRIGRAAGLVCPHPVQATFYLHGSFATTYSSKKPIDASCLPEVRRNISIISNRKRKR